MQKHSAPKKKQEAEELKQRAKAEELQMQAEQRDAKALEEALPIAMEIVTNAEDMIDVVGTAASPLAVENAEEMNESMLTAIGETEAAVVKAQEALKIARAQISQNLTSAKQYAPEARKVALTEYSALQEKLNDAHKKLGLYVRVRKETEELLAAKKERAQFCTAELKVEKLFKCVIGMRPSQEHIKSAESVLTPVANSLASFSKFVDQRLQNAQGALRDEFTQMQERVKESKTKFDGFRVQLRNQMEHLQVQQVLQQALEKTQSAEDALLQTTDV